MNVNWNRTVSSGKKLGFSDLALNETFKNTHGRGAVYVKVKVNGSDEEYMLELATGKLFPPTSSPLERVRVEVNVDAPQPNIY